MAHLIIIII